MSDKGVETPSDVVPLEPFLALRRADGELLHGEYAWMKDDHWTTPSNADDDEPTVYQLVEMRPVLIEERTYLDGRHVQECQCANEGGTDADDDCEHCEGVGWVKA